jgi:hypothetical protein
VAEVGPEDPGNEEGHATPPEEVPDAAPAEPPPIPPSPWETEEIRLLEEGEVLGIRFSGDGAVSTLPLDSATRLLASIDELVSMAAATRFGNVGARGPAPLPDGVGHLGIAGFAIGSAVFYLTTGEGETFVIGDGEAGEEARVEIAITDLIELVSAGDSDQLLEVAREKHERLVAKYVQFLEALTVSRVSADLLTRRESTSLSLGTAESALVKLEASEEVETEVSEFVGMLYEANARSRGFRLELPDGSSIGGKFEEALYEEIPRAWNHVVRASVQVSTKKLVRSGEERKEFLLRSLSVDA